MMTCKRATQLMSEELDRPLSLRERVMLGLHLMMCSGCTHFRRQMSFLRRACRRWVGANQASDD